MEQHDLDALVAITLLAGFDVTEADRVMGLVEQSGAEAVSDTLRTMAVNGRPWSHEVFLGTLRCHRPYDDDVKLPAAMEVL